MPPVYEALLLNTVVPQIQAAQTGDSYVMVVNATTPALRITQTGTGDSILVEDAANPDSSPFVVTAGGDVGIGTASPTFKLQVIGTSQLSLSAAGTQQALQLNNSDTTAGTQAVKLGFSSAGVTKASINAAVYGNDYMTFNVGSDTERMRLDSSGNLGLGVTPSAWNAGGNIIEVGSAGNILFGTASATGLTRNASYISGWKYQASAAATYYEQYAGSHIWYRSTSAQVAGTDPAFSQAMTLDASGNLGVGTTSPSTFNQNQLYGAVIGNGTSLPGLTLYGGTTSGGSLNFADGTSGTDQYRGSVEYNHSSDFMAFRTASTERARITSAGQFLVGTQNTNPAYNAVDGIALSPTFLSVSNTGGVAGAFNRNSDGVVLYWTRSGAAVGDISVTTTSTAYNTSSDYRLKDNQQPLTNSGAFIDALQPKTWNWKADGSKGVGFVAHEVQEVSPGTVVGDKDAVDADGKPVMQAMEYGSAEFIANIVAELQSLRARVAQLEAK